MIMQTTRTVKGWFSKPRSRITSSWESIPAALAMGQEGIQIRLLNWSDGRKCVNVSETQ
jgi:hypothetical protein